MKSKVRLFVLLILITPFTLAADVTSAMTPTEREGYQLYQTAGGYGCHTCHGLAATGYSLAGTDIRGTSVDDYQTAVTGEGVMKALAGALSDAEQSKISSAIAFLSRYPLVR